MSLKNTKKNKTPNGASLASLREAANESGDNGSMDRKKNKGKDKNRSLVCIKLIFKTKSVLFITITLRMYLHMRNCLSLS